MMFLKSLNADEQPWGELGFRKIRVKNYYVYFWFDENRKEVQIFAVIYVRRDRVKQLEQFQYYNVLISTNLLIF